MMKIAKSQGFSLIEMTIVFIILAVLIGGLLTSFSNQTNQRKLELTQQRLDDIKEALLGYAVTHGRLPCPANDIKGTEVSRNAGTRTVLRCEFPAGNYNATYTESILVCNSNDNSDGYLPWATLGVEATDAWGQPFRYRVDGAFSDNGITKIRTEDALAVITQQAPAVLNLPDDFPGLREKCLKTPASTCLYNASLNYPVCPSVDERLIDFTKCPNGFTCSNIVAIIFSCGKNGRPDADNDADGVPNTGGLCQNPNPANYKNIYVQGAYVENQFDDILIWLPKSLLINRLVAAGWQLQP